MTVTLSPDGTGVNVPSADLVAELLSTLQQQLWAAAGQLDWPDAWPRDHLEAATTLRVGSATNGDGAWSVELWRPLGPVDAQPVVPGGDQLVFDAAVALLFSRIDQGHGTPLARLVIDHDLPLTLAAVALDGAQHTAELTQQRAQALLLDDT